MVKRAKSLKSLDELGMSRQVRHFWEGHFYSLDLIVWQGRLQYYCYIERPRKKLNKSDKELVECLDWAGYIRYDIVPDAFRLYRLYSDIYGIDREDAPHSIRDLQTRHRVAGKVLEDYTISNRKYESFKVPSDDLVSEVETILKSRLSTMEYVTIMHKYGLENEEELNVSQIAKRYNITRNAVYNFRNEAFGKMRVWDRLPALPSLNEGRTEVDDIIDQLEELRRDPALIKEAKLKDELRRIAKTPFDYADKASAYLESLS